MIRKLQYYISHDVDPYKNLAIEKYLFDTTPEDTVTLYLWQNEQTVVIGKNQNPWAECRCALLEEEGGKLARRLSGGGAVFHDVGNLNFTFLCATEHFDITHQMSVLQAACRLASIEAEISGRNDILTGGKKFSGNAFYHANGKSYHHGTILISADMEKMQRYLTPPKAKLTAKGVKSVKSRVVNLSELSEGLTCEQMRTHMIFAFQQVYGLPAEQMEPFDTKTILPLANEYGSWDYLYGKTIPFTVSCEGHFSWGHVELLMQVEAGIIRSAQVYTDAMDSTLAHTVTSTITGCPLQEAAISDAFTKALPQTVAEDFISLIQKQF